VKELGRKHGFSDESFYKWPSHFGGRISAMLGRAAAGS
jgi:hypothetical protein